MRVDPHTYRLCRYLEGSRERVACSEQKRRRADGEPTLADGRVSAYV